VANLTVAHVDGTFRLASGHVTLDDAEPSRSTIEVLIDAASVDTSEPQRDAHLRSADFLEVARYPTIAFRSTRIERADGGHWKVTGDLTYSGFAVGKQIAITIDAVGMTTASDASPGWRSSCRLGVPRYSSGRCT
jgi:polyisoprenoid-binding protein YceI